MQGKVTDGKKASAGAIETTTKAPPDTSAAKEKPVTPLVADKPPGTPGTPDPAKAVPDRAPPEATDFSAGPKQVDQQMADAQVTEDQLARSNEPEFTGALKEKGAAEQHAATAPGQVRAAEAQTLTGAKAAAGQAGAAAMTALAGHRRVAGAQVSAGKDGAKSADEAKRAQVTAKLQTVFDATKKDVEDILSGLDKKVDDQFSTGEKAARDAFTAEHKRRMDEYKDKRYSGLIGKGRWLRDKFAGLPEEANQIFVTARKGYVDRMQQVISGVADTIGAELTRAKRRIADGRTELQAAVKALGPELQAIGKEAAADFAGKFDELTESVDNKGTELVQTLASKYNEALKSVDEEIAAEKEKNKGLVAKAVDAVAGVIKTILELKDLLLGVLAKAAAAVAAIIKDPIGFLGNLVSAVGAGLRAFLANIGEHLKKGLIGWLTGAMAGAGLELPAKFDLRGIVMMIGSLLGLTWGAIRGRIVQKGIPEQAMGAVEKSVPLVQKVRSEGLGGLWEELKEKVGDLKENLFGKISEYLIPTILMAGITWIISLLNPASAFVRAVKMIIDFVSFIVNQGAQILEFVNSVLDAIIAIAGGGAGGVPALIEKALARSVPVLIGALAAILGVGGIAEKVKKFFQALSRPVMKAVDWVVGKIVAVGKKIWAKLKNRRGDRAAAGGVPTTAREKEKVARQAADDGYRAITQVPVSQVPAALDAVYGRWQGRGVKRLEVVPLGNHEFTVEASVNPTTRSQKKASVDVPVPPEQLQVEQVTATSFASSTTAASGSFSADSAAELTEILTSGASQRQLAVTDSQQGAHAEEQVTNHFHRSWGQRREEITAALAARRRQAPTKLFDSVRMLMNVSKSSCINCASYIVRFTRELRGSASSVRVAMKFASLYKGAQEVPKSNMDEHGTLIRLFLEKGQLKGTNRLGRLWGRMSLFGDRSERVTEVSGTYNAGKAGIAILKDAGIEVDVLDQHDVQGKGSAEQRNILERRNTRLKAALDEVDEKLKVRKG
ncbi:phage tail protein [Micromonospora zhanjiangensis]